MLLGRDDDSARIEQLLSAARGGRSGVLVLRGEPGIGKTSLVEHATDAADGLTVLRARGVESEIEIAFAGLHELLRPVLGALDRLPTPQRDALRGALGMAPAADAERHLVGAATLALLGVLAEERPVLVAIDDLQWLDAPSAGAVVFAARRLLADAVVVLLAVRSGEPSAADGAGLAAVELAGLAPEPAAELLGRHAGRPVAQETAAWLHAATGGNPLALVELAREAPRLRPAPVGAHMPVGARIERALGRRLDGLSEPARASLVAVAVADADDVEPVLATAGALGGSLAGIEEAETAGLVSLSPGRVGFRHPLVRSAVLAAADPSERRAAHRAYAAELRRIEDRDRRAWHAAAGAVAPDEAIAAALAATGERAAARGGPAAAAAALEHAARLTPDAERRAARLHAAAEAAWLGGDGDRALALLADAMPLAAPAARAEMTLSRGRILARQGPLPLAVAVLRDGGEAIAAEDPARASEMLAEATYAAFYGSQGRDMEPIARRAVELAPPGDRRARCLATSALGATLALLGEPGALEHMEEAAGLLDGLPELQGDIRLAGWLGVPALFLRTPAEGYAALSAAVARARERGAVGVLPFVLFELGVMLVAGPRWAEARATLAEAVRLAREGGSRVDLVACETALARLEARQGRLDEAAEHAAESLHLARELGMPLFESWALHAQGDIARAHGDVPAAIAALEVKASVAAAASMHDPDLSPAADLVELYLRAGRPEDARRLAAEALAAASAKGHPWALARATRADALVTAEPAAAQERFAAALALHEETTDVFETARTRLCLGERLRRDGRRADARPELRHALEAFEDLSAAPWADAARAELAATGETVRRREPSSLDELTAQELRIALMLADGATTRQAAAALYLSPKTVEYHLRHVYMKLSVNSRAALAGALASDHSRSAMSSAARAAPPSETAR